jgi:hypothetical protein
VVLALAVLARDRNFTKTSASGQLVALVEQFVDVMT